MQDRYHVVAGPPLSPQGVSAERLGALASALNALAHPAATALTELTAGMVELAFNSLPPKHRQSLLDRLGIRMAAPRRAGSALCRDILARLQRESRQNASVHGVKELTHTVMNDVGRSVFPQDGETVSEPVSRWGGTLVRCTVFAWCTASVADARVLVWMSDHDWFGMAVDEEESTGLAAVRATAQSVVEAYPDFLPGDPDGQKTLPKAAQDRAPEAGRTSPGATAAAVVPPNPVRAEDTPIPMAGESGAEDSTDPEEACRRLEDALAHARQALDRVADAIEDGRPPHDGDLLPLTRLGSVFEGVADTFRTAGIAPVALRLEDLERAARQYWATHQRDLRSQEVLTELLTVGCPPDSPAASAAEAARTAARRLLDSPAWAETERQEADGLTALVELIRLGRRADAAAEILALQKRVVQVPACAMAAVMAHELTLTQPTEAVTAPEPGTSDATGTQGGTDDTQAGESSAPADSATNDERRAAVLNGNAARDGREPEETGEQSAGSAVEARPGRVRQNDDPKPHAGGAVPEVTGSPLAGTDDALQSIVPTPAPTTPAEPSVARNDKGAPEPQAHPGTDDTSVEQALARLVVERRFGLAHHVARAAGRPGPQVEALRLAGAAALLTSGDSHGARLVADLLQQPGGFGGRDVEGSELVLLPALLRTALVTGDHVAGAQLKALVPRLPGSLGEVATTVADRALSGALMIASPLVVIADASQAEARLRDLREQGRTLLAPQRRRFARATAIAKHWLAPDGGLLGSLLTSVIADDRAALPDVRDQAERLSKLSEVNGEIDRMDRKYRSSSGKPLQGAGRQDLVHLVGRVADLAKEWCLVVEGTRRSDRTDGERAVKEISSLRRSMLDRQESVLTDLEQLARCSGPVAAAAAWAARTSMDELFALLAGGTGATRPSGVPSLRLVLDAELLKVCDTLDERPALDRLLTAVDRGWADALAERLAHDSFTAARTIVDLATRGLLPGPQDAVFVPPPAAEIEEREATRRTELKAAHHELLGELHRAQADGAVTEDQDLRLQELLADARARLDATGSHDLLGVRRALDKVREDLPAFRQQATDRIRARLDALDLGADERDQVLRHLDTGGLATAADLVYFLEIGEPVPEIEAGETHLTEFFPSVPDGLPKGIGPDLVELVRSGGKHPGVPVLDYSNLSSDEAALTADALDEWRELGATEPKDRLDISARRQLLPALKLLGYDAKSAKPLDERSPHRREYRFFEVTEVEINGRAKAPDFGSQIKEQGGSLSVLMVWGRPPAKVVMSLASRDTSATPLLVVYFGTLAREARIELAARSAGLRPMLVVDDAAMAYLAASGYRQVSTATQTLLPFSGVNPYIREKRGRIGGEMFYGRDAERKSVLDPRGTQVIFGGRGLGKSALLSDAGEHFVKQGRGHHQSVYINLDQENIGKGSSLGPEALWSVLDRELTDAGVLGRPQGRKAQKDTSERVRAAIRAWLDGDSRRRLLILLDECDQFFEADAPRFDQTKKLKGLGSDTKDRAKVVFAGLHSVQRFSKLASNGPFGHLAQTPKVIGPLAPQFAADLLVEPMRALGFEFADVDLVNRVLGYCSYQPFLLQMFGHRLVEVMHRKRARRGAEAPPYTVGAADIEAVESDTDLRDGISAAFKDTLSLDHRYDVIANVLAHHARHHGLEMRLSDAELREECETFWRRGFEQLDTEGFRAYLSEMVGLGVLAPNNDGQGWHLRGPNALRMIGTSHEVEARLLRAEQDCRLQESIVQEGRPDLPDGRPAPLTITQLDDLLGERANQTRIVLGTPATGVTDVGDTLRTVAGRIADWKLPPVGRPSVYKQELTGGRPRERRVVISDFASYQAKPETCREAVDLAETLLPHTPGVTRAVVIVTGPDQLDLWRTLLSGAEPTSAAPVVLRRHDHRGLRGWAQRVEMFHTDDRLERLHTLTGGWPLLVDQARRLHQELGDPDEALSRLAGLFTDRSAARAFARETGVYADPLLATGYRTLAKEFGEDRFDSESAVTAVACQIDDEEEARWVFTCLDAFQVFDREDTQLRLEPLLRQCVALDGDVAL
ncbi:hypothetical protein [Streptomyces sp. NPDC057381]|uniref:hypothetical protein n=1 Tax=Streptomyces sp. NPDC057381 TaxID=3346111 RepID=UPI00363B55E1